MQGALEHSGRHIKTPQSFQFEIADQNVAVVFCEENALDRMLITGCPGKQIARIIVNGLWRGVVAINEGEHESRKAWLIQLDLGVRSPITANQLLMGLAAGFGNIARHDPEVDFVLCIQGNNREVFWSRETDSEQIPLVERIIQQGDGAIFPTDKNATIRLFSELLQFLTNKDKKAKDRKTASRLLIGLFPSLGRTATEFAEIVDLLLMEEDLDHLSKKLLENLRSMCSDEEEAEDRTESSSVSGNTPAGNSLLSILATLGVGALTAFVAGRARSAVMQSPTPIAQLPDGSDRIRLDLGETRTAVNIFQSPLDKFPKCR
ncbi:MAG: hypothetical protein HQM15_09165 [Deltaproteobacteria bacterium]|nr:hypothetical protein [Deltaproteobacteria bacterium]